MNYITVTIIFSLITSCKLAEITEKQNDPTFCFAYFTDIHLNEKKTESFHGLKKAISHVKSNNVEFILTGGDNVDIDEISDAAKASHLYREFKQIMKHSNLIFYPTIGNHDRFWATSENNPSYNEGIFEEYFKSYYSFDYKGWHFIVLNTSNSIVDHKQKQWLTNNLANVDNNTPIIISTHVPFLSVYYPTLYGEYTSQDTFSNFKEIWEMFDNKNLKLVLQGHMHLYEEIKVKGVQFITAGAVSANWWNGPYHGTNNGYLKVEINGNDFQWEYINY